MGIGLYRTIGNVGGALAPLAMLLAGAVVLFGWLTVERTAACVRAPAVPEASAADR